MAFLWTDSCDVYTASADLTKKWTSGLTTLGSNITWSSSAGRFGGGAIQLAAGATSNTIYSPQASINKSTGWLMMGAWFKLSNKPTGNAGLFAFVYGSSSQWTTAFFIDTNGHINLGTLNNGAGAGIRNVCDNQWHWIECRGIVTGGAGGAFAYVDGILDLNGGNGLNWAGGNQLLSIGFINNNATMNIAVDDVICYHDSGASPALAQYPLGMRQITAKLATSDSSVQFSPDSGGNNFSRINEVVAGDDANYVQSNTINNTDLYNFAALGYTPQTINGVVATMRLRNHGAGNYTYAPVAHSGATTSAGATATAVATYDTFQQEFATDPNTSAAWTGAGVDAATFGIRALG
jgi:hypothetical protein